MTLDEAIKRAEKVAEENQRVVDTGIVFDDVTIDMLYCDDTEVIEEHLANYKRCANEYRQLAEWLKELKQLREQIGWVPVSKRLPKENGWYQCTVIINDLSRTIELFYKNGKWLDNRRINMFDTYDIYGYGNTKEKHKLSYQELISEFEWSQVVIAWKPLSQPYKAGEGCEV